MNHRSGWSKQYIRLIIILSLLTILPATQVPTSQAQTPDPSEDPNLVINGDFEEPILSTSSFLTYYAGANLGGWVVASGSVDLVLGWQPASGNQSLDLAGNSPGGVYQDVETTEGQSYLLKFAMAGNPASNPSFPGCDHGVKQLAVRWDDTVVATPSFNTAGHDETNMGWDTTQQYMVTATTTLSRLSFMSKSPGPCGPTLDKVSLSISKGGLSLEATPDHVWANGHKEATITATLTDENGQAVQGHTIRLEADPATEVDINDAGPGNAVEVPTDQDGKATFKTTSTKVDTITFTATDASDPNLTDDVDVEFERRKIVVQVLGIRTNLQCDTTTGICIANDPQDPRDNSFKTIRALLTAQGFQDDEFLWYSYQGGAVDSTTGQWKPRSYICENTGQDYRLSIGFLRILVKDFGENNPNTDFYLVGHSQGGLIAFQELGLLESLAPKTRIASIITLDSPIGGVPPEHSSVLNTFTCWRGDAGRQLNELYKTVPPDYHNQQGTYAQLLCSLPGIALCSFDTNAVATAGAPTFTFGNNDDGVFNNTACPLGSGRVRVRTDNTSSQVVSTAGGGLSALGGNDPLLGNPLDRYANCISNSHSQVFTVHAGSVASVIGKQIGHIP